MVLIGCGGLGCAIANMLVRAGVGRMRIVDRDYVERENLLHQILYDEDDVHAHRTKALAAQWRLQKMNSNVNIEAIVADVHCGNIEEIIVGSDVVMDGTDNFETRYLINDACTKLKIPWIFGGVAGSRGMSTTILPGITPCLRCIYPHTPSPENIRTCDTQGVVSPAVLMVASFQVADCLKLITGEKSLSENLIYYDAWDGSYARTETAREKDCPTCQKGEYPALRIQGGSSVNVLCGRKTAMITYYEPKHIDLFLLARKLEPLGNTEVSEEMLFFRTDGYDIAVFPDGRAIIKGTEDPHVARGLYSKYIGN